MKRKGFNGYVYDFSLDYDATNVNDIKDIHKYLMKKKNIMYMKIFKFAKKVFSIGLTILSHFTNASSLNGFSLSCISMNNQECETRPQVININGDEPVFFPFSIERSKCSGSCNNIDYPYLCS